MTDSGTTNSLPDSATRTNTAKAALYGTGPLVFDGSGSLSVTGSYKHGIWSSDYIHVLEGTISVAVSAKNAIQIVNKFVFDNGALTIDATGTTVGDKARRSPPIGTSGYRGEVRLCDQRRQYLDYDRRRLLERRRFNNDQRWLPLLRELG